MMLTSNNISSLRETQSISISGMIKDKTKEAVIGEAKKFIFDSQQNSSLNGAGSWRNKEKIYIMILLMFFQIAD